MGLRGTLVLLKINPDKFSMKASKDDLEV